VNGRVVSRCHNFDSGPDQLAAVCLAFIAQHVILGRDDDKREESSELL
jgi:hypothetical protein